MPKHEDAHARQNGTNPKKRRSRNSSPKKHNRKSESASGKDALNNDETPKKIILHDNEGTGKASVD
jgi:hypothetical protein